MKTALGATESVAWEHSGTTLDAIDQYRAMGYTIVALEQAKEKTWLQEWEVGEHERVVLVLGHEVEGVDQAVIDIADAVVEIPQFGSKHSFNVSVSAGIVLWEICRKRDYSQV